jgi:hypothetical protein
MHLDGKTLYYMACCDSFRDGKTEAKEQEVLERLRSVLRMGGEEARDIEAKAREDQAGSEASQEPLEPRQLFSSACRLALVDEVLELGEAERLTDLSEILGFSFEEAEDIFAQVREEEP